MPRPYECVRRAWHSDRHNSIRGSLIQEIFRVVNEVHSSATKKNIEWQEKLPIVVLRAEEIMYSKANSEAEYSDLQTLWGRVNDAINTIIRIDETTETGVFLQPCIEAALHLGCTPRRSSRSERNYTPRDYLRPEKLEGSSVLDPNSNSKPNPLIFHCPQNSTVVKDQEPSFRSRNSNHVKKSPKKFPHHAPPHTSKSWTVYPLCYDNQIRPKLCSLRPSISKPRLVGGVKAARQQKLDSLEAICPSNDDRTLGVERGVECDLTLRLGTS